MRNSNRSRLHASALTFLAAAGLYLAVPGQPEAAASSCSASNNGKICWENESCVWVLFYKQCTKTYKFLPAGGGGGGGGGDGDNSLEEPADGGGCEWGRDYQGWEPRRCE